MVYQKENYVRINSLPSGNFRLLIRAQSGQGVWAESEITLDLIVPKPFYKQAWFLILVLLSLLGLIGRRFWVLKRANLKMEKMVDERTQIIREDRQKIKQQAEELEKLLQVKSNFFSNVSHELRTPLLLILGPVKRMIQSGVGDSRMLEIIRKNSQKLLYSINEILDISNIEKRSIRVETAPLELYAFLEGMMPAYEDLAADRSIRFACDLSIARALCLATDKVKLERCLDNLLTNAFKFTPSGGSVKLQVSDTGEFLLFRVTDTGQGIPEQEQERVFERFYQSESGSVNPLGGLGIGLALIKEYVQMMNGKIEVESTLGEGAVFRVAFPVSSVNSDRREARTDEGGRDGKLALKKQHARYSKPQHPHPILLVVVHRNGKCYPGVFRGG